MSATAYFLAPVRLRTCRKDERLAACECLDDGFRRVEGGEKGQLQRCC